MKNIIEIKNLYFAYNNELILNNVSFNIENGDFLGIIGGNGTGKSTLLKLILGLLHPLKGEINLFGTPINKFKDYNKITYVPQKVTSFNGGFPATVEEIVASNLYSSIGLFKFMKSEHREKVKTALQMVGMESYSKRLISELSGGQQQRVFIARSLVCDPSVIFLDEPTVGIDHKSESALYSLLNKLNSEFQITIIMVTHDISAITVNANKILCLNEEGFKLVSSKDIKNEEFFKNLYSHDVKIHIHNH